MIKLILNAIILLLLVMFRYEVLAGIAAFVILVWLMYIGIREGKAEL